MENQNIVLDFSPKQSMVAAVENQPLALMSATLAQKLLKMYANNLRTATDSEIIAAHIRELRGCTNVEQAIQESVSFIDERTLIANVVAGNFEAYAVSDEPVINGQEYHAR